jgi:hypothetical protein
MAIYDYGAGRTYATPQAAFDACQAANESNGVPQDFTETHYIRGYGGATYQGFASGEPVLRLVHSTTGRGVKPTPDHRLAIDRNGTDPVDFADDQEAGCLVGGKADGTSLASYVTVDGINLHSSLTAAGRGLVVCPDRTGGEFARDWVIQNLSVYAAQHGIVLGNLRSALLSAVRLLGFAGGAGVYADGSSGTYGAFSGGLLLSNCIGRSEGKLVLLKGLNLAAALLHCSFYAVSHVLELDDDGASASLDLIQLNSIFHTAGDSSYCLSTDFAELRLLLGNGNCYYAPNASGNLVSLAGSPLNFDEFRARFGQDRHSLNTDPKLMAPAAGDFTLAPDSPCRMRGRAAAAAGIEGNERALSVDIGAYQPSLAANWDISVQGGQLTARIEGRVPVSGI